MHSLLLTRVGLWPRVCIAALMLFLLGSQMFAQGPLGARTAAGRAALAQYRSRVQSSFIENRGQWNQEARFLTKSDGMNLWVTRDGLLFDYYLPSPATSPSKRDALAALDSNAPEHRLGHVVRMRFIGASPAATAFGTGRQQGNYNYFIGDRGNWRGDVPHFGEVRMERLYGGIDGRFYFDGGKPRYDLIVAPGADPEMIRIRFEGAEGVKVDEHGDLVITTSIGLAKQDGLYAYQVIDGARRQVPCRFLVGEDGMVRFAVGRYDCRLPLVIDPLTYSTFLGGGATEDAYGIAIDASGNAYITGNTTSNDFPTTAGAYSVVWGSNGDVFVTKLNPAGNALVYSTFIGSSGGDVAHGIALDASNNAYITGASNGLYPTTAGAFAVNYNGGFNDAFVTKLNSTGSALLYSTYLGGTEREGGYDIAVDAGGHAYVTGHTWSNNFPTTAGAYDRVFSIPGDNRQFTIDAFVTKLNPTGTALSYSTYLGASSLDYGYGIALDDSTRAYVVGYTESPDFPATAGAYDQTVNVGDGFVTRLNAAGTALSYSTLLGGDDFDGLWAVAVSPSYEAYVTGYAGNGNYPTTPGAFSRAAAALARTIVVTRLNSTGTALIYSTMVGQGEGLDIALDNTGAAYVSGLTRFIPTTPDAFDGQANVNDDGFVVKMNPAGSTMIYGSYIGGNGHGGVGQDDRAYSIAVDNNGDAYVAGTTSSQNTFPTTTGAYDSTSAGTSDGFVAKFPIGIARSLVLTSPNGGTVQCDSTVLRIAWTSSGINAVKLELSSDGGATFPTVINASVAAVPGSFAWTIPASVAQGNQYRVRISDTVTSNPLRDTSDANITINRKPVITTQPGAQTVCQGQQATFSVAATGATGYQWRKNGTNINGATSATYSIPSPVAGDAGNYDVVVSNAACPVTSTAVALVVNTPPAITTQPGAQTVCQGQQASFSVSATGTGLTYQWRKNGTNINGATSATYTIASPTTADAGNYDVVISGTCTPQATSTAVALTVNTPPAITSDPTAQTVCQGQQASFNVSATGTGLSYQWRKNGTNINGATGAAYSIPSPVAGDAGSYDVVVSGTCTPPDTSAAVTLVVNTPPEITNGPAGGMRTLCQGETMTLNVTATGTGLTYQWRKNNTAINGATSATYTIPSVTPNDDGIYDVVVSGTCTPAATSAATTLKVNTPPSIITQPTPATRAVCRGGSATFTVAAGGTGLTYQWRKDGTAIAGATGSAYTIPSAQVNDAGSYDVVISGACTPSVTSNPVTFTVNVPPSITAQPSPSALTVCQGTPSTFSVTATGTGLTYQWRKDGADIPGANAATFTIPSTAPRDAGRYDVVIGGTCAPSVTSTATTLAVNLLPAIIEPPANITVCPGHPAVFYVTATGTGITYQWRKNGAEIIGATGTTLVIDSPGPDDVANYDVVVSGTCTPAAISGPATLEIREVPPAIDKDPQSQTACAGETVTLRVQASGSSLSYQWRKDGKDLPGATLPNYTINAATAADAGNYDVVVKSACASTVRTSSTASLIINEPATISEQPASSAVCTGGAVAFQVKASGTGLTYQWRRNGTPIPGATQPTLTLTSATQADAGRYDVAVGSACQGVIRTSSAATLVVNDPASITTQPQARTVKEGETVSFSLVAIGTDITYQWRKNGAEIPGATTPVYTIPTATIADTGVYDVVMTGACPTVVTSQGARLVVTGHASVPGVPGATAGGYALVIMPNPVTEGGYIRITPRPAVAGRDLEMSLYDMMGRKVLDLTAEYVASGYEGAHLEARDLPAGLYFCRVTGLPGGEVSRVIAVTK